MASGYQDLAERSAFPLNVTEREEILLSPTGA
jgi:hypothetical protein